VLQPFLTLASMQPALVQSDPKGFDYTLVFYALAFLLPVVMRLGAIALRFVADLLGIELSEPKKPAKGVQKGPARPVASPQVREVSFPAEDYPVFEETPRPTPLREQGPLQPGSQPWSRSQALPGLEPDQATLVSTSISKTPALSSLSHTLRSDFKYTTKIHDLGAPADPSLLAPVTLDDWRRAIILQEILAPPLSLRREHRPGELSPFDLT